MLYHSKRLKFFNNQSTCTEVIINHWIAKEKIAIQHMSFIIQFFFQSCGDYDEPIVEHSIWRKLTYTVIFMKNMYDIYSMNQCPPSITIRFYLY